MLIASTALVSCEDTEQAKTEHAPVFSTFIENSHTESKERLKKSKNTSQSGSNEQSNGNIKIDARQNDVPQYNSAYHTFSHSDYYNPEENQNNNGDGYSTISYSTYYNGHDYNINNENTNSNESSADQAQQVGSSTYYTNYNENTNENRKFSNQYSGYYNPSASVENGIYNYANNVYYPSDMNHNNGKASSRNDYNYDAPDNANGNSPFYNNAYSTADTKNGYNTYYTAQHSSAENNNEYTGNSHNNYNNEPLNSVNVHGSANNNAYNANTYNKQNSNNYGYSEINGEPNTFSYNNIPNNNNNAQTNSYNNGYANTNYNNVTNLNNSDKFKTIYNSNAKGDKYYNVANTNKEYIVENDSNERSNNGFKAIKNVKIKTNKKKIRRPSATQNAENKHHYKIVHYKPRTADNSVRSTAGKIRIVFRYVDAHTVPSNKYYYNSTVSTGASDSDGAGSSPSESVSFPSNYLSGYSSDLSGELDELENGYSPQLTGEPIEDVEEEIHDQVHHVVSLFFNIIITYIFILSKIGFCNLSIEIAPRWAYCHRQSLKPNLERTLIMYVVRIPK